MGATLSKWYFRDSIGSMNGMATKEQYLNLVVSIHEGDMHGGEVDTVVTKKQTTSDRRRVSLYYNQGSLMDKCVDVVCEQLITGGYGEVGKRVMQTLPAEVMQLVVDRLMVYKMIPHLSSKCRDGERNPISSRMDPGLGDGHLLHNAEILMNLEDCEFYDVCLDGAGYTRIISYEHGGYQAAPELHHLRHNLFPKRTLERVAILNKKPLPTSRRILYSPNSLYDDAFLMQYIMGCGKLRELHLEYCDDVTERSLSSIIPALPLLEVLRVRHCHNVKDMISHLMPKIEDIQTRGMRGFVPLSKLHTISFESCLRASNLGKFFNLIGANSVIALHLSCCSLLGNNDAMEISVLGATLEELHIGNTGITDVGLRCLSALEHLKQFSMPGLRVRDSSIAYCVSKMANLESLDISRCFLAGDGTLASLSHAFLKPPLKTLSTMFTNITDDGLSHSLPLLNSLENVNFESCNVSDIGLVHLKHARDLRAVCLADTQAGNDTMESLSHLKHLSILDVSFTNAINDIGLKFIGRMQSLDHLILESFDRFSTDALRHLVQLQHLKTLDLFGCKITDKVCSMISNMKSLKKLDVGWGVMSGAGVRELSKLSKLRHLSLAHCHHLRDDSLSFLLGMKHLSSLNISDSFISDGMILLLSSSLPSLKVLCLADTPIKCHVLEDLIKRNHTLEIKGLK